MSGSRCVGTYIHGILDNPSVIDWLVAPYAGKKPYLRRIMRPIRKNNTISWQTMCARTSICR